MLALLSSLVAALALGAPSAPATPVETLELACPLDASQDPITEHKLVWKLKAGGVDVGTRSATIKIIPTEGTTERIIESFTDVRGKIGPVDISYQQRLTAFAADEPASFQSVIRENGAAREIQGRWGGNGWTIVIVDGRRVRSWEAPVQRIQMSTADLMDPLSRVPLSRYTKASVLATETGDVWEGAVTPLEPATLRIGDRDVDVSGVAWESPEGRVVFWYDADGWLVKYQTRVLGILVEGTLTTAPPRGADAFSSFIAPNVVGEQDL
jgi:hypothetical protein